MKTRSELPADEQLAMRLYRVVYNATWEWAVQFDKDRMLVAARYVLRNFTPKPSARRKKR